MASMLNGRMFWSDMKTIPACEGITGPTDFRRVQELFAVIADSLSVKFFDGALMLDEGGGWASLMNASKYNSDKPFSLGRVREYKGRPITPINISMPWIFKYRADLGSLDRGMIRLFAYTLCEYRMKASLRDDLSTPKGWRSSYVALVNKITGRYDDHVLYRELNRPAKDIREVADTSRWFVNTTEIWARMPTKDDYIIRGKEEGAKKGFSVDLGAFGKKVFSLPGVIPV